MSNTDCKKSIREAKVEIRAYMKMGAELAKFRDTLLHKYITTTEEYTQLLEEVQKYLSTIKNNKAASRIIEKIDEAIYVVKRAFVGEALRKDVAENLHELCKLFAEMKANEIRGVVERTMSKSMSYDEAIEAVVQLISVSIE